LEYFAIIFIFTFRGGYFVFTWIILVFFFGCFSWAMEAKRNEIKHARIDATEAHKKKLKNRARNKMQKASRKVNR
jgi:hypothetical protein